MPRHKNAKTAFSYINIAASIAEIYSFRTMCHDFATMSEMDTKRRVYLDWAAATPLLPQAKEAMEGYFRVDFGNPSAVHEEGQIARNAVETARANIARAMQVRPEFVTFTGGGTEANNIAIFGGVEALCQSGLVPSEIEVITTRIEHPSVSFAVQRLERMGVGVKYADVTETGRIDVQQLRRIIGPKTRLVSTAYINSEIGTIQPLHALKKVLVAAEQEYGTDIYLHVDAAQAPLWVTCQFDTLGADAVTFDFGKCCGPKGVGALVRSRRMRIVPTVFGGGQESGLRPGTENVAAIVGAAIAFCEAQNSWRARAELARSVRDYGIEMLEGVSGVVFNGARGEERVANNINISLPGFDTEYAAVALDAKGCAVSTKSACSGASGGASVVVRETTEDPARAASTLRITIGPDTTVDDLNTFGEALRSHIALMTEGI